MAGKQGSVHPSVRIWARTRDAYACLTKASDAPAYSSGQLDLHRDAGVAIC
jgi:hypothetical protein